MNAVTNPPMVFPSLPTAEFVIFRKSENTNSFGLRGYWAVECKPRAPDQKPQPKLRVWSFATSEDLAKGKQALPVFLDADNRVHSPAYEIPCLEGTITVDKVDSFLGQFASVPA